MRFLFLLACIPLVLSSCNTGDPSEGGLFGWSPGLYNERIDAKRQRLSGIESDTAAQRREAARLQRQINSVQ